MGVSKIMESPFQLELSNVLPTEQPGDYGGIWYDKYGETQSQVINTENLLYTAVDVACGYHLVGYFVLFQIYNIAHLFVNIDTSVP